MLNGLFITFEGGDGSGKSTQIELLRKYLTDQGYEVVFTREPGGTRISEAIRNILLDPEMTEMAPVTEMMLYAAARAQLVDQVIRPALKRGCIVICDRFLDSSVAYQGYGRSLGDAVQAVNAYGIGECMPDLTVYLRLDPEAGRQRIGGRAQDRIESEADEFHRRVFEGYEALCRQESGRIMKVDASGSIEEIADQIRAEVLNRIHDSSAGD